MRRHTILGLAAAATALAATEVEAVTFLQLMTGDEATLPEARSIAMGKSRGASPTGGFTAESNPALLPSTEQIDVTLGIGSVKLKETRSIPAYDSFDAFLVESIYVLNDSWYPEAGFGVSARPKADGLLSRVALGASLAPVWDYRYHYSEQVRDPSPFVQPRDQLLALNTIESDGQIGAWTFGAGLRIAHWLSVGASYQYLSGKQDLITTSQFIQEDRSVFGRIDVSSLSGNRGIAGVVFTPHHSVSFSGVYRTEMKLDGNYAISGDEEFLGWLGEVGVVDSVGSTARTYPQELRTGVSWRPRAKMRTTVQLDLNWREWSAYNTTAWEEPELKDVFDVRLGLEHVFYNDLPVRFGFLYAPSPQDKEITTTAFTFGGGFASGPVDFDLAFEIGNRTYRYQDVFDDGDFGGSSRGDTNTDLITESTTGFHISLNYAMGSIGG